MRGKRAQRILGLTCIVIAAAVAFAVTGHLDKAYAAGSKTIYVIDGKYENKATKSNLMHSYKYNKKGLLVKDVENISNKPTYKYKYNKKNQIVRITYKYGKKWGYVDTYAYNSSGQLKSCTSRGTGTSRSESYYETFVCNKAGLPVKGIVKDKRAVTTFNYSYNKKGRVVSQYIHYVDPDAEQDFTAYFTYKYDKKGNLKSTTAKDPDNLTGRGADRYKNTYKKGRLVKVVMKTKYPNASKWEKYQPTVYTYKKIKVSKKMIPQIKKQQWALLNNNLNAALGGTIN